MPRRLSRSGVVVVTIIIVVVLLSFNSRSADLPSSQEVQVVVDHERASLASLLNSTYGDLQQLHNLSTPDGGSRAPASTDDTTSDRTLNLTGLRPQDGYAWSLLPGVQQAARTLLHREAGDLGLEILDGRSESSLLVYENLTGWARGGWTRAPDLETGAIRPPTNLTHLLPDNQYITDKYARNITGSAGRLELRLDERDSEWSVAAGERVHSVSAKLTIEEEGLQGREWSVKLYGVHVREAGVVMVTTTSEKFEGIFALPQFALSNTSFELSKTLLNRTITRTIERQGEMEFGLDNPWDSAMTTTSSEESTFTPACELVVYMQQQLVRRSVEGDSPAVLHALEQELQFPTGFIAQIPPMELSLVAFSPDCGYVIQSKGSPIISSAGGYHIVGYKIEVYYQIIKQLLIAYAGIMAFQFYTTLRQIKRSSTSSAKSRISFHTISMLCASSAYTFFFFLVISSVTTPNWQLCIIVGFLGVLDGSVFGMRFMMDIWNAQEPERNNQRRLRERQTAMIAAAAIVSSEPPQVNAAPATNDVLPPPATAPNALPTVSPTPANHPPRPFSTIYFRYCLLLTCAIFLTIAGTSLPSRPLRNIITYGLTFGYFSFWLPQIHRNIIRNCRKSLSFHFILWHSILRPLPFLYFWIYPANIFAISTSKTASVLLMAYIWLQVFALFAQARFGARCFVSTKWAWVPAAWDYHVALGGRDEEAGLLVPGANEAEEQEPSEQEPRGAENAEEDKQRRLIYDCTICMQKMEVDVEMEEDRKGRASGRARRSRGLAKAEYMVTPCRHIFHTRCLEAWMEYRLQCPICRESLPPV